MFIGKEILKDLAPINKWIWEQFLISSKQRKMLLKKALVLYGPSNSGKTSFIETYFRRCLFGTSQMSLDQSRYGDVNSYRESTKLWVYPDVNTNVNLKTLQTLQKIIDGSMSLNIKYVQNDGRVETPRPIIIATTVDLLAKFEGQHKKEEDKGNNYQLDVVKQFKKRLVVFDISKLEKKYNGMNAFEVLSFGWRKFWGLDSRVPFGLFWTQVIQNKQENTNLQTGQDDDDNSLLHDLEKQYYDGQLDDEVVRAKEEDDKENPDATKRLLFNFGAKMMNKEIADDAQPEYGVKEHIPAEINHHDLMNGNEVEVSDIDVDEELDLRSISLDD